MKATQARYARGKCRAAAVALLSGFVASCTSVGETMVTAGMPAYNSTDFSTTDDNTPTALAYPAPAANAPIIPQQLMDAAGDTELPEQVASLPTHKPTTPAASELAFAAPAGAEAIATTAPRTLPADGQTTDDSIETARKIAQGFDTAMHSSPGGALPVPTEKPGTETAIDVAAEPPPAQPVAPRKRGLLAALFGSSDAEAAPVAVAKPIIEREQPAKPIVTLVSSEVRPMALASSTGAGWSGEALPGVRKTALFEITRKSGIGDNSDVDLDEGENLGSYQVASAAGMAHLGANGLLKQTESVDVACLKPALLRVLKIIERHYGRKAIVTSGYRDPNHNRRARGAKNSLHMYCAAADIQVPGVSKWELASFARAMPGRGGVGTYCRTNSVHVDVGPQRDWNWRCRRRK